MFGLGSAKTAELLSQALRQLEILAYNPDYRDANGHPPSLQWNFPRGVTPEVAAALESLRITDPRTGEVVVDPRTGQPLQLTVTQDAPSTATDPGSAPGSPASGRDPAPVSGREGNDNTVDDRAAMANITAPSGVPKLFRFVIKGVLGAGVPGMAAGTAAFLAAAYSGNVAAQLGAAIAGVAAVVSSVAASIAEWKFERIKEKAAAPLPTPAPHRNLPRRTRISSGRQVPGWTVPNRRWRRAKPTPRGWPAGWKPTGRWAVSERACSVVSLRLRIRSRRPVPTPTTVLTRTPSTKSSSTKLPAGWAYVLKAGAGPAVTAAVVGIGVWVSSAAATMLAAPVAALAALASFAAWTENRYQRYKTTLVGRPQRRRQRPGAGTVRRRDAAAARPRGSAADARAGAAAAGPRACRRGGNGHRVGYCQAAGPSSAGFAALFDPTPADNGDTSGRADPAPTTIPSAVPGVHRVMLKSLLASGVPGMTAAAAFGWAALAAGNPAAPAAALVVGTVAAVGSILSGAGDWVYDRLTERLENRKHAKSELDGDLSAEQQRVIAAMQALLDQNDERPERQGRMARPARRAVARSQPSPGRAAGAGIARRAFAALVGAGSRPSVDPAPALPAVPDPVRPDRADDQSTDDRADTAAVTVDYAAKLPRGWAFFFKAGLGAIGGIAAGVVAATVAGVPFLMLAGPTAAAVGATVLGALADRWFQRRKLDASEAKKAIESQQSEAESIALLDSTWTRWRIG